MYDMASYEMILDHFHSTSFLTIFNKEVFATKSANINGVSI
jgi:hypothetical protein